MLVLFQVVYLQFRNIYFLCFQNFWAMLAIGVIFLLASIVLAATNSSPVPAIMAYVSLIIVSFTLHLSCILSCLPFKPHPVCGEKTGQGTEFSALGGASCFRASET